MLHSIPFFCTLQEAYLSGDAKNMKAFFTQLSSVCVSSAASDVDIYYHVMGMSRFFYLHWKGGFKMEDSLEAHELFFNGGMIDALFTILTTSVANFEKLQGKNKALPYLTADILQDITGSQNQASKKICDAICTNHTKELNEIIYEKFLCLKFTVMEHMTSLLLVTNLFVFKSGFEWFMSRNCSELLDIACTHSFHLGCLLKETCIFNKLPRKFEKAIIQAHADIKDNIDLAINTIEGKKASFAHMYTRSFDTACGLNRFEELCTLYYNHKFFDNLVARMLHFCPGCSMYPGRDHQGLQALTYATAHLIHQEKGQNLLIDTLPLKDKVPLPAVQTLQHIHVPLKEPKLSKVSVLGVISCHALTSVEEPFPCTEAREIISILLTNRRKHAVVQSIGGEVLDIAHGACIVKSDTLIYNKKFVGALLECGGFIYSNHPCMRYPPYDFLMHRHMYDRYMPRMPRRLMEELGMFICVYMLCIMSPYAGHLVVLGIPSFYHVHVF